MFWPEILINAPFQCIQFSSKMVDNHYALGAYTTNTIVVKVIIIKFGPKSMNSGYR